MEDANFYFFVVNPPTFLMRPVINILNAGMDCGFCPPLPSGEGWGEGIQKNANRDRS